MDFFKPSEIADAVVEVLNHPSRLRILRKHARHTICTQYDLRTVCLPQHLQLIDRMISEKSFPER